MPFRNKDADYNKNNNNDSNERNKSTIYNFFFLG